MHRRQVDGLDPKRAWWALAVVAPERDWPAAPGCRKGARFLVAADPVRASLEEFAPFESRLDCLNWVMSHRPALAERLPGVSPRPVRLDRWLLGLE